MATNDASYRAAGLLIAIVGALASGAAADAQLLYTGVNLSGAEFGVAPEFGWPGEYNHAYIYPTAAEVDYFRGKGMNTVRLPFRWERLQQSQFAAFNSAEQSRLDAFVNSATGQGSYVILDPHNFARYYPPLDDYESSSTGIVGSPEVPNTAFADFWSRLAGRYKNNGRVIFNLMNEPNNMPTEQWLSAANAAIAAIRAAGADNLILVPGNGWTGAWTWQNNWYGTPNATAMLGVVDPGNNYAYDVHQYLNHDGSGATAQIGTDQNPDNVNIGVERLTAFTQWLKTHNKRAFLGEFGVANSRIGSGTGPDGPRIGDETLVNMLNYVRANSDVWMGWSWWAAGPWWQEYQFTLEPTNLGQPNQADRPAMAVLQPYLAPLVVGDFNGNGTVDAADYVVWRDGLGTKTIQPDYDVWKANFGRMATSAGIGSSAAVPESSAAMLFLLGNIVLSFAARRSGVFGRHNRESLRGASSRRIRANTCR